MNGSSLLPLSMYRAAITANTVSYEPPSIGASRSI
jgi:hypothetical protein